MSKGLDKEGVCCCFLTIACTVGVKTPALCESLGISLYAAVAFPWHLTPRAESLRRWLPKTLRRPPFMQAGLHWGLGDLHELGPTEEHVWFTSPVSRIRLSEQAPRVNRTLVPLAFGWRLHMAVLMTAPHRRWYCRRMLHPKWRTSCAEFKFCFVPSQYCF